MAGALIEKICLTKPGSLSQPAIAWVKTDCQVRALGNLGLQIRQTSRLALSALLGSHF
jgi:hypothetical protein